MKNFILIFLTMFSLSKAQIDTTSLDYFPLEYGNIWEYRVDSWGEFEPGSTSYRVVRVVGDTVILDKKYIHFASKVSDSDYIYHEYFRVDSSTSIVYKSFFDNGEYEYYKLNCAVGDTALQYSISESKYYHFRCSTIYDHEYLNQQTTLKLFGYGEGLEGYGYHLSQGLGIIRKEYSEMADASIWTLIYAKINGIEYGTSTNINVENVVSIREFQLFQNYPNPFNPSTNISFALPSTEKVIIEVFNTLGQKIESLLHEKLKAGNHVVEFKSANLPSGVYFYRIKAGNFQDYKKMILLK